MNTKEYEAEVKRTMSSAGNDKIAGKDFEVLNFTLGLAGESGEVVDFIKKVVFHGHDMDRNKIIKELGDVEWYLTALRISLGFTVEEIREANVAKLRKRYKQGFSREESQRREEYKEPLDDVLTPI